MVVDYFLRDVGLLIIGALVGSFVAPLITTLRTMRFRTKTFYRETERAWLDHKRWFVRHDRALQRELARIDEEMSAKGLLDSGIRVVKRNEAIEEFSDRLIDHWSEMIRRIQDVGGFPGRVERAYIKRWGKKHGLDRSAESFIIEGAQESLDGELEGEEQQLQSHR